jgi:hypothetical protein
MTKPRLPDKRQVAALVKANHLKDFKQVESGEEGTLNFDYISTGEGFLLSIDTRHGKEGYRVSRYENGMWDEWYQFYTDLNDFFRAVKKQDYKKGQQEF